MGPSVEDELLITAAHTLFENTYITAGELLHLKTILAEKSDIDAAYIVRSCRENNWLPAFRKYILYADNCSKCYSGRALFDPRFVSAIGADAGAAGYPIDRYPPYFLPPGMLISSYAGKFFKDIVCMKFRKLPRELVTFGLVIWLWRHKKMQKFKRGITV
jgi:hypothetical protein